MRISTASLCRDLRNVWPRYVCDETAHQVVTLEPCRHCKHCGGASACFPYAALHCIHLAVKLYMSDFTTSPSFWTNSHLTCTWDPVTGHVYRTKAGRHVVLVLSLGHGWCGGPCQHSTAVLLCIHPFVWYLIPVGTAMQHLV